MPVIVQKNGSIKELQPSKIVEVKALITTEPEIKSFVICYTFTYHNKADIYYVCSDYCPTEELLTKDFKRWFIKQFDDHVTKLHINFIYE